jgi:hypothetical protein
MIDKKEKAEQYTKLPAALIASPVLRNLPQRAFCVLLAILEELNKHRGKENGNLIVTYKDLKRVLRTSDKTTIALSIKQVRAFGVVRAIGGGFSADGTRNPTRYGVTWLPGHNGGPPSNEWKEITSDEQAQEILAALKKPTRKTTRFKTAELADELGTKWSRKDGQKPTGEEGASESRDDCRSARGSRGDNSASCTRAATKNRPPMNC